jgi:hypothetical protein
MSVPTINNRLFRKAGRREFLCRASATVASGLVFGGTSRGEPHAAAARLPTIRLGKHCVTRLIAGWNPIGGYSYLGHAVDREMKEYFTTARTVDFLLACERAGINAHQFSPAGDTAEVLDAVRQRGSKMQFICLDSGRDQIRRIVERLQPMAMAHHGGATDALFRQGKSGLVHDFVKAAHDRGVLAGVSAHNPDCIKQMAHEGWEVDFFMTCFHFLTRPQTPAAPEKPPRLLAGPAVGYPFYAADPAVMTEVARQVKPPCLGFKILGAGRKCTSQQAVREAFAFAFTHLKPTDGVIVGMYPKACDQISLDAGYTREFGASA